MKHAILATLVAFTGLAPAMESTGPSPVTQRLMQIDLDVATRHYEKLQGLLRDAKLEQLVGLDSDAEQAKLARRIEVISHLSDETRVEILKLGQALEGAGATVESPYRRGRKPVDPTSSAALAVPGTPGNYPPSAGGGTIAPVPGIAPVAPPLTVDPRQFPSAQAGQSSAGGPPGATGLPVPVPVPPATPIPTTPVNPPTPTGPAVEPADAGSAPPPPVARPAR